MSDEAFHVEPWRSKPCSNRCGRNRDLPHSAYCRECKNERARQNRPSYAQLSQEERKRSACRATTLALIKRGEIVPRPCEDCGATENVQVHHVNYDDPRDVRWKCKTCHRKHHHPEPVTACANGCGRNKDATYSPYCRECRNERQKGRKRTRTASERRTPKTMCNCGRAPRRPRQRTCALCHARYMQTWRETKKQEQEARDQELQRLRAEAAQHQGAA